MSKFRAGLYIRATYLDYSIGRIVGLHHAGAYQRWVVEVDLHGVRTRAILGEDEMDLLSPLEQIALAEE